MLYRIDSSLVDIDPSTLYRSFDFRTREARLLPCSEPLFCALASSLETYWHCLSSSRQLQLLPEPSQDIVLICGPSVSHCSINLQIQSIIPLVSSPKKKYSPPDPGFYTQVIDGTQTRRVMELNTVQCNHYVSFCVRG
jgi:hypothetical protein